MGLLVFGLVSFCIVLASDILLMTIALVC